MMLKRSDDMTQFQSTLSMRRATGNSSTSAVPLRFQSTLSMRRATAMVWQSRPQSLDFNPRSP